MNVSSYAATSKGATLEPFEYEAPPVGPDDARVEVSYCGICFSDIHMIDDDGGMTAYPFVPGHEIVGTVKEIGEHVQNVSVGDRVGIGWQGRSCGHCPECLNGDENSCVEFPTNGIWTPFGGFGQSVVSQAKFVIPVPDAIDSEHAASLMCGGVTVYEPLRRFARPAGNVGVIGIGGLGHMALQFASAYGCEVTAFSSSDAKQSDAAKFGAHNYVVHADADAMAANARKFDLLLMTAHANLEWGSLLALLKPLGKLVLLGVPSSPITINPLQIIFGQAWLGGTIIGSPSTLHEMLTFATRHNVQPQIETVPMSKVNDAIEKLRANKARYRMVLSA